MPGLGTFGFQLQEAPSDRRIITTTRSHSNKVVTDCVEAMEPDEVVRVGGAGNKVGWISCIHPVQPRKCCSVYQNDLWRSSSLWKDELLLTSSPVRAVRSGTPVLLRPSWVLWEVRPSFLQYGTETFFLLIPFYCIGKLTDVHGNTYRYDANVKHMNSAGVLATLRNHEYYISRVPQSVLQALKLDWCTKILSDRSNIHNIYADDVVRK